jgi:phenylpropionate dioxygenase-like ring-hydroxylating dioxygenase large terminal subunit
MGSEGELFAFPRGLFVILFSDELAPGQVAPMRYLARDFVLFRTETGAPRVLDAFCPHLGAHLGHGGVVEGEELRCPFHAWKFNGTGECSEVPYAKKIPPRARIACAPLQAQ